MITVRLSGGLGNQMFQYAAAYAAAKEANTSLYLDLRSYNDLSTHGGFCLGKFKVASRLECNISPSWFNNMQLKLLDKFPYLAIFFKRWVIERSSSFNENILKKINGKTMHGYWQSEKYFQKYHGELVKEFIPMVVSEETKQIYNNLLNSIVVAIHIRRGDYISNPNALKKHGFCSISYYKNGILEINSKVDINTYAIFSDDMAWAKENLSHFLKDSNVVWVEGKSAIEDLWLMTACSHHIISNSTFSWWGAWLAQSSGQIVIAPTPWFDDLTLSSVDIIPESWIVLSKNCN